jgi:putative nucleotidyltransferase with HDIG domain
VRLGTRKTIQLVMADVVGPIFRDEIDGYHLSPGDLWEHSVAVSVATEELARELKLEYEAYIPTAALLIDIGKTVLGTFIAIDSAPILDCAYDQGMSFDDAERFVLGIDHAEVGAVLLKNWGIPENIVNIVRFHHQPEKSETHCQALDLVHTADLLASEGGFGIGDDGLNYLPDASSVSRLKVDVNTLERVLCKVHGELASLRDLFKIGRKETA